MIGLPFITDLFKNVLEKSRGIQGRHVYCPKMGQEINADDLDQVIENEFSKSTDKKFPCAIMMPPVSSGDFTDPKQEWEKYNFIHFFLTTTYYSGINQVKNINPNTNTSTHTIMQDQHDMGRCARNFIYVLSKITRSKGMINCKFRLTNDPRIIRPVTGIGANKLSGVRLDFSGSVFGGCNVEDYDVNDIDGIVIPESDSHEEHNL